ncbi:hypothetical protein K469DRAFT_711528 [Zopfia rhizophila CBS 207.26]|uniref:Uncharacterized protein n=1 Tax=Zopfia rhizophila CBS 207.26 TaxID=1314779 RepID=A0A6A6DUV5_9PEZI|nr:hypothetical protein K469DRAFT_711528 [Zopfia rhizophila CBS 207.26]
MDVLALKGVDKAHFTLWAFWIDLRRDPRYKGVSRPDKMRGLSNLCRREYLEELADTWLRFGQRWRLPDFQNWIMLGMRYQSRLLCGTKVLPFSLEFVKEVWMSIELWASGVLRAFIMYAAHEAFYPHRPPIDIFDEIWDREDGISEVRKARMKKQIQEEYDEAEERFQENLQLRLESGVAELSYEDFDYFTWYCFHLDTNTEGHRRNGPVSPTQKGISIDKERMVVVDSPMDSPLEVVEETEHLDVSDPGL